MSDPFRPVDPVPPPPGGYPTAPYPAQQPGVPPQPGLAPQPGFSPQPGVPQPAVPRPPSAGHPLKVVVPLAVVAVVLALATGATWWKGSQDADRSSRELSTLDAAHRAHADRVEQFRTSLQTRYAAADLGGKMATFHSKDDALVNYWAGTTAKTGDDLRKGAELEADCMAAVVDYDHVAAAFSDEIRGTQPKQIDMTANPVPCLVSHWVP